MSAWLVNKGTIDCLVQEMIVRGIVNPNYATEIGAAMWMENHKSLHACYGDPLPESIDYVFEGVEAPLDQAVVLTQAHCYNYQTCEHEEWRNTASWRLLDELVVRMGGWDVPYDGPWRIETIHDALLVKV